MSQNNLDELRRVINDNLRMQRRRAEGIPYIDVGNVLDDSAALHHHVIYGRRGCGKTTLLHSSEKRIKERYKEVTQIVYINCEIYKNHSFPNVLIEILDDLFEALDKKINYITKIFRPELNISGQLRKDLDKLKDSPDHKKTDVVSKRTEQSDGSIDAKLGVDKVGFSGKIGAIGTKETEERYKVSEDKMQKLNIMLPEIKDKLSKYFDAQKAKYVFLQLDDFYHFKRTDQPFIMDYIHMLCKELPIFFKVSTFRHSSALYIKRHGQPIGVQERHDFQPIDIDFTFDNFAKTVQQNHKILYEYGRNANWTNEGIDGLFKGDGFERLVWAGGGVPRDVLSLFIDVLEKVKQTGENPRIGKDDVRLLSRTNLERRIDELKQDSEGEEQKELIAGIYVIRQFSSDKRSNVILVSEAILQKNDKIKNLLNSLLDYRIIHTAGSALTHKSQPGTYHAFVIDMGCYANMRVLQGKFTEIDLNDPDVKEKMRSSPILSENDFVSLWGSTPVNIEEGLRLQEKA